MFHLDHEELGQDGDGLEVDGESPEDLHDRELVASVREQGQEEGRTDQEFNPKMETENHLKTRTFVFKYFSSSVCCLSGLLVSSLIEFLPIRFLGLISF